MKASSSHWVVVASLDHAEQAVEGGFVQAGHGRHKAVERFAKDDWVVVYSPRASMRSGAAVQAFTAIGRIVDEEPYAVARGALGTHHRRHVDWRKRDKRAEVKPLIGRLGFVTTGSSWGMAFRRGLFRIDANDFATIAQAMGVKAAS